MSTTAPAPVISPAPAPTSTPTPTLASPTVIDHTVRAAELSETDIDAAIVVAETLSAEATPL